MKQPDTIRVPWSVLEWLAAYEGVAWRLMIEILKLEQQAAHCVQLCQEKQP